MPQPGKLNFLDVTVNQGTDTVQVRAIVPQSQPHPGRWPARHRHCRARQGRKHGADSAACLPARSIRYVRAGRGQGQQGPGPPHRARRSSSACNVNVAKGLNAGETIVTEGIQRVRPGQVVQAERSQAAGAERCCLTSSSTARGSRSSSRSSSRWPARIALTQIPIAQFPDIVPPQISVTANYPGASAQVVEATVAQPIESRVVGVDNMLYMKSTSGNDGSYTLTVTFAVGTDPDLNTVKVQNRVSLAEAVASRRGEVDRRQRHQEVVGAIVGGGADLAGQSFRSALSEQLRHHQHHRQSQAHQRRRRRTELHRQPTTACGSGSTSPS